MAKLVDIGNYSHELALLYKFISEGFDELGEGIYPVDDEDMFKYIIRKSKGRFNPAMVKNTLKQFEN